jgi:hypothetical protein
MDRFPPLGRKSDFEGTFGEIWLDASGFAHKKFKATTSEADRQHLLELNFLLEKIRPSRQRALKTMFAWPLEIYGTQNSVSGKVSVDGYRMPAAGPEFQLTLPWRDPSWDKKRSATLDWLVDENARTQPNLSKPLPSVPLGERIEIAYQFLLACRELWGAGCVYGDFSYKNILWTGGPTPSVLLLDTDTISANPKIDRKIHSPYFREFIDTSESASAKDVKLAMLVVWRVLFGGLRSTPDAPGDQRGPQFRAVVGAIKNAWRSGRDTDAYDVITELHGKRDDSLIRSHLQAALELDTVYARQVLDHKPHSLNGSERDLFREAAEQLKMEEKYERRTRRRRSPTLSSTFSFDIASWYEFDILNQESLFEAFRDGDFEIIATEFPRATSTSPNLHVIRRAVEHALVEVPTPKVSTMAIPRGSEIQFAWPPGDWINQAVLALYASDGSVLRTHTFQRGITTTRLRITNNSSQIIDTIEMAWAANSEDTKVQVISPSTWRCQFSAIASANPTKSTIPVTPQSAAPQWTPAGAPNPTVPAILVPSAQRTVPAHRLLAQRPHQTVVQSGGRRRIRQFTTSARLKLNDFIGKTRRGRRT